MGGLVVGADVGLDLDDPARAPCGPVADEAGPEQRPRRVEGRPGEDVPVERDARDGRAQARAVVTPRTVSGISGPKIAKISGINVPRRRAAVPEPS